MTNRLVAVGDDFTLPAALNVTDTNLPTASKAATIAAKLDTTIAAATYAAKSVETSKLDAAQKGAANGVAPLGADSKVPDASLPTRLATTTLNAAYAPSLVGGKAPVRKDELAFNVKDYGAKGDGVTDDATAIKAAIAAAFAVGGGIVFFPAGTFMVGSTLTFPMDATTRYSNITLRGAGPNSTVLRRTGNFILLDISGTDTARWIISAAVQDLKLIGAGATAWTEPVVRSYYSQFINFNRVNWDNSRATALSALQMFDSYFYECRWDYQGNESATGWPIWIKCNEQGAASGWGWSNDNSNNMWFINCVMEQCRGGGIYLDGRDFDGSYNQARQVNRIYLMNWKFENAIGTQSAPAIKVENANHFIWDKGHASSKSLNPTAAGARFNIVELNTVLSSRIANVSLNALAGATTPSVRTGIAMRGGNSLVSLVDISGNAQVDHSPSVALVEYTGINTGISESRIGYYNNPAGARIFAGSPSSKAAARTSPADASGLLGWSFDLTALAGSTQALTSGALILAKIPIKDHVTLSTVCFVPSAAGAGLTGAYAAIYSSTGDLLGLSANSVTDFTTGTSPKAIPVTAQAGKSLTFAGADGEYVYAALLVEGTTPPLIHRLANVAPNAFLAASTGLRFANGPTGLSVPPAALTTSAFTSGVPVWLGVA